MRKRTYFAIGFAIISAITAGVASALPPDFATPTLNAFNNVVAHDVTNFINDTSSDMYKFTWIQWSFFSVVILTGMAFGWVFGTSNTGDLVTSLFMILGVAAALASYDTLTQAVWSYGDIGLAYQKAVLGHEEDPMWPATKMQYIIDNLSIKDVDMFSGFKLIFWTSLYLFLALVISVMFYISSAWSMFGYGLVKIIGYPLLPLIMVSWTRGVFDGWVKLFMGFVFFNVISRVIMVMLVRFFDNAIGATPDVVDPEAAFGSYVGVVGLLVMGILFLLSAAGFAGILAGGFTSAGNAGRTVTRAISTIAKAIA